MGDTTNTSEQVYQEGIKDILKATTDVDYDELKSHYDTKDYQSLSDDLNKAGDSLEDIDKRISKKNRVDNRSIVAIAKQSILQFPVYITDSNRATVAHTVSKLFERVYADFVQSALASHPFIDEDEANNLVFLKNFHTNINEAANVLVNDMYEPIDNFDEMMQNSLYHTIKLTENCDMIFRAVPTIDENIIAENARLMHEPLAGLTYVQEKKLEDVETVENKQSHTYTRKELEEIAKNISTDLKDDDGKAYNLNVNKLIHYINPETRAKEEEALKSDDAVNKKARKAILNSTKNYKWVDGRVISVTKITNTKKSTREVEDKVAPPKENRPVDLPRMMIKEADVKKTNGMLPYTIECSFRVRSKDGKSTTDVKYLVSIKTVLHLVSAKDLTDELREIITGNIKSLRKVKYRTGEIGFKDYIFDIKNLKSDAAKNINQNKRWINTLKKLSEYNKTYGSYLKRPIKALTGGNVPIPNATLVITSTDVITLKENTGIDLNEISNVKRLAKNLFLVAFAIVDASAGTMKVLFPDNSNSWDIQSLASVEAEIAKSDNSNIMKELNKMVNR